MRAPAHLAVLVIVLLGLTGTASANGTASGAGALAPSAATSSSTTAKVSQDALGLAVRRPFRAGHHALALSGASFAVEGGAGRSAQGRLVTVRLLLGSRAVATRHVRIDRLGRFATSFTPRNPGAFTVRALLPSAPGRVERRAATRVPVYQSALHAGLHGPLVRWVQERLHTLGYLRQRVTGRWTSDTGYSVLAYRDANRIRGLDQPTHTNLRVLRALRSPHPGFVPRYGVPGRHVEANLSKQVVVLLEGRRIVQIIHTSSGRRALPTILGTFHFYYKDPGRNKSRMYDSNYFIRGYAVHGYDFVPEYPDSHGCLRIPLTDADFVFGWIRIGDRMDVYK